MSHLKAKSFLWLVTERNLERFEIEEHAIASFEDGGAKCMQVALGV